MKYRYFLGIDIGKSSLACCLRSGNQIILEQSISNKPSSIKTFFKKLSKQIDLTVLLVCAEHTGIYSQHLLAVLEALGIDTWMEPGIQIKQSSGFHRGKSDESDARMISDYAYTNREKARLFQFPRPILISLHALSTTRERLLKNKTSLLNALKEQEAFLPPKTVQELKKANKAAIQGILKSIQKVEQQMKELITSDTYLKQIFKLITSITGIGKVTAIKIIVHTGEFKKITSAKKFACYAGVAPFSQRSGTTLKTKPRVHHFAYKKIKSLLHMCAMSNIASKKEENKFKIYYEKKIEEGKHKMSAINALRNKLIQVIFGVVKNQQPFDPCYKY